MEDIIYLDNAASSWPKPDGVAAAVADTIARCGANPGRGSHRMAVEASRILFRTRKKLADLFGIRNPNDIAFALNTTAALNTAILGYAKPGDHVVCTGVEHNSVRRPLEWLKQHREVRVTYTEASPEGDLDASDVKKSCEKNTTLIVVNHSSNVLGSIAPIADIADIAHSRGAKLLVDAAQTAGVLPLDVAKLGIDMLAFPGHKSLYGPQGTGGLYIAPDMEVEPLVTGGTGSQSEAVRQPPVRPDRYESGTMNTPGIAGLGAGVDFVASESPAALHSREWTLTQYAMEELLRIPGIRVLGPGLGRPRTAMASFTMEGIDSAEIAFVLDQHYRIAVRAGYHCAPLAHQTAKTEETGAVRASFGAFTTAVQIDGLLAALRDIRATLGKPART